MVSTIPSCTSSLVLLMGNSERDASKLSLPAQCHFVLHQVFPVVWRSGLEHSDLVLPLLDLLVMNPGPPAAMISAVMMLMTPAACNLLSPTPM